ncbi:MAG: hypothetical protein HQL31_03035 [Planctomycetes bacterium]|nr:hypothetical protein [Planctomycetota bacterium]
MSPKQRMLSAYRGELPDTVPVAPEFWYYLPARLLGLDMVRFEREVPLWEALLQTFLHYGTEGWGTVFATPPAPDTSATGSWRELGEGRYEECRILRTPRGELRSSQIYDLHEPSWAGERPIKNFSNDWPAYKSASLGLVEETDWKSVNKALDEVGESYLLEPWLGVPFFDYIATPRAGGMEQGLFDLLEHEAFFTALHEEYIDYMKRLARDVAARTTAEAFFIGCSWSCVSLIGPELWRRWDKPVLRAVADELHAASKLLHVHFHGRSRAVLEDLSECGADCICPFERAPGGDIADLGELRRKLGGRVTVNGNVHTVETLIRGSPADVEREVEEIFEQWGKDKRRLILGTGDQVGRETSDENIAALISAGRRLGRCRTAETRTHNGPSTKESK